MYKAILILPATEMEPKKRGEISKVVRGGNSVAISRVPANLLV